MSTLSRTGRQLSRVITKFEDVICTLGLYTCTILIFIQVLNRYVFHTGVVWIYDLALYIYMMSIFIATALATRERGHVAVDYFYQRWLHRRPIGMARYVLALTLLSLAIALVFAPQVFSFMMRALEYQEHSALLSWFNTSWIKVVFSCSIGLVLLHLILNARQDLQALRSIAKGNSRVEGGE